MDFPRKRFIELVKKYVHFRRVKEIQETVRRMKMDSNVNERVLLSLKEIEDRMIQVIQNKFFFWSLYLILIVATIKHWDSFTSINKFLSLSMKPNYVREPKKSILFARSNSLLWQDPLDICKRNKGLNYWNLERLLHTISLGWNSQSVTLPLLYIPPFLGKN